MTSGIIEFVDSLSRNQHIPGFLLTVAGPPIPKPPLQWLSIPKANNMRMSVLCKLDRRMLVRMCGDIWVPYKDGEEDQDIFALFNRVVHILTLYAPSCTVTAIKKDVAFRDIKDQFFSVLHRNEEDSFGYSIVFTEYQALSYKFATHYV